MVKMKSIKILISLFIVQTVLVSCSSTKINNKPRLVPKEINLSNFDREKLPNDQRLIAQMIEIVQPELSEQKKIDYAKGISRATQEFKVNPQIIIALIDTESDFNFSKISHTGDLSLAQVNVEVWNKEFKRMKATLIDIPKLVSSDQTYAISTMARILATLKKRYAKTDRRWYARYHSNTKKYKWNYLKKIEIRMRLLEKNRNAQVLAIN